MNKEIEILIDGKSTKMELPPDMQDSKIVIENGKVFAEIGVVDYINNLKFENKELKEENQRLNNVLSELEKWLKEQRDFYFEYYYYSDFNAYGSKLDDVLDKLKELKESDK